MPESIWLLAFVLGAVSAASLPLGSLTAAFWSPTERATAVLMAFGGGALLAALTLDMVGVALGRGHTVPLVVGAILGGLLFIALNEVVNDFGGFLRKASTSYYHLRRRDYEQSRRLLRGLKELDIFRELSSREFRALAGAMHPRKVVAGASVFRHRDPADTLYLVAEGQVELIGGGVPARRLGFVEQQEALGWLDCLTGSPHAASAVAVTNCTLWCLPRDALVHLTASSPSFLQAMHRWLRCPELTDYLHSRQGMDVAAAAAWCDSAVRQLVRRGTLAPAVPIERRADEFLRIAGQVRRFPILQDLPEEALRQLAGLLLHKQHWRGETIFLKGDVADRMYIIDRGQVSLFVPEDRAREPDILGPHDAFGAFAWLTGGRHTSSAVATEDTDVWVLRRHDFDQALRRSPGLARALALWLSGPTLQAYLASRQHLEPALAQRWQQQALRRLETGRPMLAVSAWRASPLEHRLSPLAIWLGILLDAVPESAVIGASVVEHHISLSLLVGLFLSNYPEALSSTVVMRQEGLKLGRVLLMWTSVVIVTGVGAAIGNLFFVGADPATFSFTGGLAAGAMLTMIAQTMLPEAYLKGGSVIGLSTLLGFLSAILAKTLE